jgi:hypothetical protein
MHRTSAELFSNDGSILGTGRVGVVFNRRAADVGKYISVGTEDMSVAGVEFVLWRGNSNLAKMPKVTLPSTPLNGLFAISKPSGPPSMVLLDRLKALFSESTLFVSEEEAKKARDGGGKGKGKGRKAHKGGAIKMGQGGTLDPLADGILGTGFLVE